MKSVLLFLIFLQLTPSYSGLNCEQYTEDHKLALRITKTWNAENELRFGVKVNADCTFSNEDKALKVYWYLAKREQQPCEDPFDDEVKDMIGYKSLESLNQNMTSFIDHKTMQITLPNLPKFAKTTDSKKSVSTDLYLTLKKENEECQLESRTLVSGKWIELNRIHNIISLFWLKRVEYLIDDEKQIAL